MLKWYAAFNKSLMFLTHVSMYSKREHTPPVKFSVKPIDLQLNLC